VRWESFWQGTISSSRSKEFDMGKVSLLLLSAWSLHAQTTVDLRTQSKTVDFAAALSTRPMQTGTVLPSLCSQGQMFFNSGAPAGQNLYGCTATNVWTLESGGGSGGGGGLPAQTGSAGYLTTNGSSPSWGNITTGGSGALDCSTIPGQCDIVTALVPLKATANAFTGANDFSASPFLAIPTGTPSSSSAACTKGSVQYDASFLYICVATNSWRRVALASF
jgi:hypothetical protein